MSTRSGEDDVAGRLALLLSRARALTAMLEAAPVGGEGAGTQEERGALEAAAHRLQRSVIRPVAEASGRGTAGAPEGPASEEQPNEPPAEATGVAIADRLWELARDATTLRGVPGAPREVQEAAAALQDLALGLAQERDEDVAASRLIELRELQAGQSPTIQVSHNGPYLVTNVENLTNWLGERLPARPQMALCRCGASKTKPFCDGSHAEIDFSGAKSPDRVPDRRDTYEGLTIAILDNRGTCQHSGFCTDRLNTVFRLNTEPFIAPSGGRMDEIIRAVRDCPSGALSYALGRREAREQVDHCYDRGAAIEVSKDGPYRVTGSIALIDDNGKDEPRNDGASCEHYALCRCGASQNKPFCSGMHWSVEFKDPVRDPDETPTIFEWVGGLPALTRMTRIFYEKYVPDDELLAPLFANMSSDHPERVAKWLAEVFCGPKRYSTEYGGYPRMISQHLGKALTEEKRARWVQLILRSAQEAGLPADPEFRSVFSAYIDWGSRLALENSQTGARPPEHMPMPHWDWNTAAGPPGSRISALAPAPAEESAVEDRPPLLPHSDEPVSFEKHIVTLFRQRDRRSMKFAFDLWAYDDLKQNAHAILERVRSGSMPCDTTWPPEQVDAFERWVNTGMRP